MVLVKELCSRCREGPARREPTSGEASDNPCWSRETDSSLLSYQHLTFTVPGEGELVTHAPQASRTWRS
jgi:hypothetical protein